MFIITIIRATRHAHLKLPHWITLTISAEEYKFHTAFRSEDFTTNTHWSVPSQGITWLHRTPPASLTLRNATAMYANLCPIHYIFFFIQMSNMLITHTSECLKFCLSKNVNKRGSEVIFQTKLIHK
jgi:hypothetical protein